MSSLDLPAEASTPPRRLIVLVVEPAHDVGIDYEGEFALWEVRAILERARDQVIIAEIDAEDTEAEGDEQEEKGLE